MVLSVQKQSFSNMSGLLGSYSEQQTHSNNDEGTYTPTILLDRVSIYYAKFIHINLVETSRITQHVTVS